MSRFKDAEHLLRLLLVFLAGVLVFLVVRRILVPRSFGEYGHYRGDAVAEIAAQPVVFAGHSSCETCHSDVVAVKARGAHARVNCEACHGALAKHAEDPGTIQPPKLDTAVLCPTCHASNTAKPARFPQVRTEEHSSGLPCDTCHQPHNPRIASEGKK